MTSRFQSRTQQKLLYAKIHIDELSNYAHATSNDDWENAHQESTFFHLVGAVESLLHRINEGYSLGLDLATVTWRSVAEYLKQSNQSSPAFEHLSQLRNDESSWLALLFEWRNHGTHRGRVGKIVNLSNWRTVDNEFLDPRTGRPSELFPESGCQESHR